MKKAAANAVQSIFLSTFAESNIIFLNLKQYEKNYLLMD